MDYSQLYNNFCSLNIIAAMLILFITFTIWYCKLIQFPKVKKGNVENFKHIFYIQKKTSLKEIGQVFNNFEQNKGIFKQYDYQTWGFYYDDPSKLIDQNDFRYILAIVIDQDLSSQQIKELLQNNDFEYHYEIKGSTCLKATFNFRGGLSFFLGIMITYNQFKKYYKSQNIDLYQCNDICECVLEKYLPDKIEFYQFIKKQDEDIYSKLMKIKKGPYKN